MVSISTDDHDALKLRDILANFDHVQHVPLQSTQHDGAALDLAITKGEEDLDKMMVYPPDIIADHSIISLCLSFDQQPPIVHDCEVRQ